MCVLGSFRCGKIIYRDIAWQLKFMMDDFGYLVNNTVYFIPTKDTWILAVLNAPVGWWFAWRTTEHGKDEALRYFTDFVEFYPVPTSSEATSGEAHPAVSRLSAIRRSLDQSCTMLRDWYRIELDIQKPTEPLLDPFCLTALVLLTKSGSHVGSEIRSPQPRYMPCARSMPKRCSRCRQRCAKPSGWSGG